MGRWSNAMWMTAAFLTWVPILKKCHDDSKIIATAHAWKFKSNGVFYTETFINEQKMIAILDTGATEVVLSLRQARQAKARLLGYEGIYEIANGHQITCRWARVTVRIGAVEVPRVLAAVCPYERDTILLGQSFLKYVRFTTDHTDTAKLELMGE